MTSDCIDQTSIIRYLTDTFEGVDFVVASQEAGSPEIAWGDTFFFYNPRDVDPDHMFPFATIVTKDYGDFDSSSQLNRPGVFRLNIGLDKKLYQSMFGASREVAISYDFAALDEIMPHPVYARQYWVCVLNPSAETFEAARPLLAAAYALAVSKRTRGGAGA